MIQVLYSICTSTWRVNICISTKGKEEIGEMKVVLFRKRFPTFVNQLIVVNGKLVIIKKEFYFIVLSCFNEL